MYFNLINFGEINEYYRLRQTEKLEVSIFYFLAVNFWKKKEKKLMNHKNEGRFWCTFFRRSVHKKSKTIMEIRKTCKFIQLRFTEKHFCL